MFIIDKTIDVSAPLARVLEAISTEAGYRSWFSQDSDFDGTRATFRFGVPGMKRSVTFRIDGCDERGVRMTCIAHENNADWLQTTLTIELAAGDSATGTRVHLRHAGYPAKNEVYERCSEAWPHFLRSLASYTTTGTGEPYPKAA